MKAQAISLNNKQFDFTEIYDVIKQYYMLGFNYEHPMYKAYHGNKKLEKLLVGKFSNPEHFEKWKKMLQSINTKNPDLPVADNTLMMQPSLGGVIAVNIDEKTDSIHRQELHFYLSILGPYYTVFGVDKIGLRKDEHPERVIFNHPLISISPVGIYKSLFDTVRTIITDEYLGLQFVPHRVYTFEIQGLSSPSVSDQSNKSSIFQALFNHDPVQKYRYIGERSYGEEYWWK